jgi:spermidine synthase
MTTDRAGTLRARLILGGLVAAAAALGVWFVLAQSYQNNRAQAGGQPGGAGESKLELDVKSTFSRIKVVREKNVRTLLFVRDTGEEVIESMLNLDRPHDLIVEYTRYMFLSYLFRPKQEKVLIVGLGGGSMVHFLKHYDPKVKVDVVEIDPQIVKIADKYFGVRSGGNVNILTQDAFDYIKKADAKYDVIYMDAFLKPSVDTDPTGVQLRLKTIKFYKDLQKRLTPGGMVVFNINPHSKVEKDIKNIRDSFAQTYVYELPEDNGLVVVGSMSAKRRSWDELLTAARGLDRRFPASYSYQDMARGLKK